MTAIGAEIRRAVPELQALAVAVREDWTPDDVQAAIAGAANAGLTWPQVLVTLPRLMVDANARPGELIIDWHPMRASSPPTEEFRAAKAAITRKDDPDA